MTIWSPDELRTFLEHVRHDRLRAVWHLLATTGTRRSEVLGLPWTAIAFESSRLAVVQTTVRVGSALVIRSGTKTS